MRYLQVFKNEKKKTVRKETHETETLDKNKKTNGV